MTQTDPFGLAKGANSKEVRAGLRMARHGVKGVVTNRRNWDNATVAGLYAAPVAGPAAGYAAGRRHASVAKGNPEGEMTDPFGVSKAYDWKDTKKNPRRKNVAVGTAVGTAMYGGLGAAGGAHTGARQARRGLTVLQSVGARPSASRSLGIAVGHAARGGGRGAAILAPIGAIAGATGGALSPARRKPGMSAVRKSAFGVEVPVEHGD